MTAALFPREPSRLEPMVRFYAPDGDPRIHYLAKLRPSGRRSQARALEMIATVLSRGRCSALSCPWHLIRYSHASALRAVLADQYAPATTNRHLSAMRGVLRESWRLGIIPAELYHQAASVQNVKASTKPRGRMLQDWELSRLRLHATPRDRALLALLFHAGLRRSEAAKVTCDDLRLEGHVMMVEVVEGKGGKDRTVPVAGDAAVHLSQRKLEVHSGPLLHLTERGVYDALERLARRAGLEDVTPHDLRRTMVSQALARGADLSIVSRMAGHADPRTTARYDRRPMDAMVEVAETLE